MFGINCAPEIFQKVMEKLLAGCEGCLNYIDDIIVFGNTKQQHSERLCKVLERLKLFDVTLNNKKCIFGVSEIKFLGHHLSVSGIKPTHDKVLAIRQFRQPETAEETRSFLGLVNYVGKFIPNLATIAEPLRRITHANTQFFWGHEQKESFQSLKQSLLDETTLGYYKRPNTNYSGCESRWFRCCFNTISK